MTRMCSDPWSFLAIKANGDVCPCCRSDSVGSLVVSSLEDIINGPQIAQYRTGLLNGNLTYSCQSCPIRAECTCQELQNALNRM
jgi:radical SAM protein with 4Fe4S-binding SPASM domain